MRTISSHLAKLIHILALIILASNLNAQMELVYNTNLINGLNISLPLFGTVNVTVDWGDGHIDQYTNDGHHEHSYAIEGSYIVTITGTLTQFGPQIGYNALALISVNSFGELGLTSLDGAFKNADSLENVPLLLPTTIVSLSECFQFINQESIENLNSWDLTNVINMRRMFNAASSFNQDIGNWNVGNVTNMSDMFRSTDSFNQDIGNWDVSNVTNMNSMFYYADSFNQDIGGWNVSNVTEMGNMFYLASSFNQDIGDWDVSNVNNMCWIFGAASVFNQDIGDWDVSNVIDMYGMFKNASTFNQDIGNWNVSNVIDMSHMFHAAESFNQDIGLWDVGNVTHMYAMFSETSTFDQDIGNWNVSNVTDMGHMFYNTESFNQNIDNWDVSKVNNMFKMFYETASFNQDISNWCVEQIPTLPTDFSTGCPLLPEYHPNWGEECDTTAYVNDLQLQYPIRIYPNPTKDYLVIDVKTEEVKDITVYNHLSQRVFNTITFSGVLDVSRLRPGLYMLVVITNEKRFKQKLIIR